MLLTPKHQTLLKAFLQDLDPRQLGPDAQAAFAAGDQAGMIAAAAAYYRQKPDWGISHFSSSAPYDPTTAQRARQNMLRVVNIDWAFPGEHVDFFFNPTTIHGPVNHEWLWQMNRHSFWQDMARAYAQTGDETYAAAFQTQLLDWIDQTGVPAGEVKPRPGIPAFWMTPWNAPGSAWRTIECGLRLMNAWPTAFAAFRMSPNVADETLLLMIASMHEQALHLLAHPTGQNWLMMESCGMYTFASLFPEVKDAAQLRDTAAERLSRELEAQLLPDGMQNELSPDYHMVVFNCASNLYDIAQHFGRQDALPENYRPLLKAAADATVALSTPGFTQPRTNDCFTIFTHHITDRAARFFPEEPSYAFVSSGRQAGSPPAGETASRFLPYAGLCAMRADWGPDAAYLCFDVGPLGKAHIHQDMLNIHVYKGAQELIFDDGGGQYEISPARTYGLSAADHNTVLVDDLPQNRSEPKALDAPADAYWCSNARFDYAQGVYEGGFGPDQALLARHRRQVRFCKPGFFAVRDDLETMDGKPHDYEVLFHLDTCVVHPLPETPGAFLSDFGKEYEVCLLPLTLEDAAPETATAVSGQTEPCYRGWFVGRNAENLHPATTIGRKVCQQQRHTFVTLLFPLRHGAALPEVTRLSRDCFRIAFDGRIDEIDLAHLDQDA